MRHKLTIIVYLLAAFLLTGCATTSFSGDYVLSSGQTLRGNLYATSGSVTLEENSRVTGTILLTSGDLHIQKNAQVGRDVALTSGALYMADGAVVHGDVVLASQDTEVYQDPGAQVEGSITYNIASFLISFITKRIFLYCVLPLVILIAVIILVSVWLGRASKQKPVVVQAPAPVVTENVQQKLQQLKSMLDEGLITETDYESKKADLLSKL